MGSVITLLTSRPFLSCPIDPQQSLALNPRHCSRRRTVRRKTNNSTIAMASNKVLFKDLKGHHLVGSTKKISMLSGLFYERVIPSQKKTKRETSVLMDTLVLYWIGSFWVPIWGVFNAKKEAYSIFLNPGFMHRPKAVSM